MRKKIKNSIALDSVVKCKNKSQTVGNLQLLTFSQNKQRDSPKFYYRNLVLKKLS